MTVLDWILQGSSQFWKLYLNYILKYRELDQRKKQPRKKRRKQESDDSESEDDGKLSTSMQSTI